MTSDDRHQLLHEVNEIFAKLERVLAAGTSANPAKAEAFRQRKQDLLALAQARHGRDASPSRSF